MPLSLILLLPFSVRLVLAVCQFLLLMSNSGSRIRSHVDSLGRGQINSWSDNKNRRDTQRNIAATDEANRIVRVLICVRISRCVFISAFLYVCALR